jgi:CubicO group peptidase (beta-lactamase class C family)
MSAELQKSLDQIANETDFSGVVRVSRGERVLHEDARGLADRAHGIAITPGTQFGLASGSKGFTALVVMSLVDEGALSLETTVRSVLGDELELIDPRVTVGHLLAHTSGIGDYLDESVLEDFDDYVLPVPVHELTTSRDYLKVLRGHPTKFPPGERFEYCNGGFVILGLIAELASDSSFYELAARRVFEPANMTATDYLRSDQLPGSAALGYIPTDDGWRTNLFHLPVRGSGDGGCYSTLDDFAHFWPALFAGKIVRREVVDEMVRPRHDVPEEGMRYGLGFWLRTDRDTVMLEGMDAGASFRSAYDPSSRLLYTVISNSSRGAWPLVKLLDRWLPEAAGAPVTP